MCRSTASTCRACRAPRWRDGWRSCLRTRTWRSTSPRSKSSSWDGIRTWRTFEVEGPRDIAIAREALAATGTRGFEDRLFATLSGGEKQRVVIAAALAQISGGRESGGPADPRHPAARRAHGGARPGLSARSRGAPARPAAPHANRHRRLDPRSQFRRRRCAGRSCSSKMGWCSRPGRRTEVLTAAQYPRALRRRGRGPAARRRRPPRGRADAARDAREAACDDPAPHRGRDCRLRAPRASRGGRWRRSSARPRSTCGVRSTGRYRLPTTSTRRSSSSPGSRARSRARSSAPRSPRRASSFRDCCATPSPRHSRSASRRARRSARCWRSRSTGHSASPASRPCQPRASSAPRARSPSSTRWPGPIDAGSRPTSCCSPA